MRLDAEPRKKGVIEGFRQWVGKSVKPIKIELRYYPATLR